MHHLRGEAVPGAEEHEQWRRAVSVSSTGFDERDRVAREPGACDGDDGLFTCALPDALDGVVERWGGFGDAERFLSRGNSGTARTFRPVTDDAVDQLELERNRRHDKEPLDAVRAASTSEVVQVDVGYGSRADRPGACEHGMVYEGEEDTHVSLRFKEFFVRR